MSYIPKNVTRVEDDKSKLRIAEKWVRSNVNPSFLLDDWHLKLEGKVEALHVCRILGEASWDKPASIIWFPNTQFGRACRRFTENQLSHQINREMGIQRYMVDGENPKEKFITHDEVQLMFKLSRDVSMGQKINSVVELENFRKGKNYAKN